MPGRTRVHELAKELGVSSKEVLAKMGELGELVKSASSTIEAPVARRVREAFTDPTSVHQVDARSTLPRVFPKNPYGLGAPAAAEGYPRDIARTHPPMPTRTFQQPRRPRREWHRGLPPACFTRYLLDELIVVRRDPEAPKPPPRYRYWADEVREAEQHASKWSGCLLDGLSQADVLDWIRVFRPAGLCSGRIDAVDHAAMAVELHQSGVAPTELGWSYEDKGLGTLADRLCSGSWTVEQVISEAEARRSR